MHNNKHTQGSCIVSDPALFVFQSIFCVALFLADVLPVLDDTGGAVWAPDAVFLYLSDNRLCNVVGVRVM